MSYDTQLKVSFLENRLANFGKDSKGHFNRQFVEDALTWNPVVLMTSIINHGFVPPVMKESDLPVIEAEFKNTTGLDSRREQVRAKHWLRIVLGMLEIPEATRYALSVFNEVCDSLEYLKFLLKFTDKDNRNVTAESMQDYIDQYATDLGVKIDVEHAVFKKYASIKDNVFQLAHPVYYKNLVEFEVEFRFLDFINKKLSDGNQPVLKIEINELKNLLAAHKLLYPATPGFEDFEHQNVFIKSDTDVVVNFNDYWMYFGDAVATPMLVNTDHQKTDRWFEIWYSQHWSRNSQFQVPRSIKEQFLDTITKRLIDDSDFVSRKEEVSKARRDADADMHYLDDELFTRPDHTFEDAETLYEICYAADQISNHPSSNILFIQSTRQHASRLLRLIVTNDDYFKNDNFHFLKKILIAGIDRPYFVYETEKVITNDRPNVIPHLLTELTLANYGLYLIAHLEIPTNLVSIKSEEQQVKEAVMHEIWRAALAIYTDAISDQLKSARYDAKTLAQRVFETIRLVCRLRYDHNSGFDYQKRFWESPSIISSLDSVCNAIKEGYNNTDLLIALAQSVVPFRARNINANVIHLPLSELHSLLIAGQWLLQSQRRDLTGSVVKELRNIVEAYFRQDLSVFKERSVWGSQKSAKHFPWASLYKLLFELNQTDVLVFIPEIKIDTSLHSVPLKHIRSEPEIRFQVERIRTIFAVVSEIFRDLLKEKKYESRLTSWYEDLVDKFTVDVPAEGRLNIFHETYDVNSSLMTNKLLPELLYDVNFLTDADAKRRLVERLMQRMAFSQLVEMYHEITSENERVLIKARIEAVDVAKLLEESRRSFGFDRAIRILAWENLLKEKVGAYVEELKRKHSRNEEYLLFQLQLFLFYNNNNLEGIKNLPLPENLILGYVEEDVKHERSLFEALLLTKLDRLEDADKILTELFSVSQRLIYRVNLFLNKINALRKKLHSEERTYQIRLALEDWLKFKAGIKEKEQSEFERISWYYELMAFNELSDQASFEELYSIVPLPIRMDPEYLILRVSFLVKLGRSREADELYSNAVEYHDGKKRQLDFLDQMNSIVASVDNLHKLAGAYEHILNRAPIDLVKLVPAVINPNKASISDFILYDLKWCLKELIKRVRSLAKIHDETKYNDVMASLLSARVAGYGWTIKDNSTGNKSGDGKDPGERDIIVQKIHSEIALIECVHIYGREDAYIIKHLQKVFSYSESKIPKFLLSYYLGPSTDFESSWMQYKDRIFPAVTWADAYKAHGGIKVVESDSDALKLGSSQHGDGHSLVHIAVNLNFSA